MRNNYLIVFIILLLTSDLQSRVWKDSRNRTMEAALVEIVDGIAYLKKPNGIFKFPVEDLSKPDQQYIKDFIKRQELQSQHNSEKTTIKQNSRIAKALNGILVKPNGRRISRKESGAILNKSLYGIYFSAHWCPPCRKFTPDLVNFYDKMKTRDDRGGFEIIFVSSDNSKDAMEKYMKEFSMPWPAISYKKRRDIDVINQLKGTGIPCLVLIDMDGKVISHSYEGGKYLGPRKVMKDLERIQNDLSWFQKDAY